MSRIRLLCSFLLVFWIGGQGFADDRLDRPWKDEAELAVVNTTGNTDVFSLYFKNLLQYSLNENFTAKWTVGALSGATDGEKTADRYETALKADYFLTSKTYIYLSGGWLRDRFAGFDNRTDVGPGVGQKFFSGPVHFLVGELGINYTMEDYVVKDVRHFIEGRVFAKYDYAINSGSRFEQRIEYLQDMDETDNIKVKSETSVTAALTTVLSLKVSYEVRYQNRPQPAELEKTDTLFGAALVLNL